MRACVLLLSLLLVFSAVRAGVTKQLDKLTSSITTNQPSALEKKAQKEQDASNSALSILLYHPNYLLPAYYTQSPDYAAYGHDTPDQQKLKHAEFKAQFSILLPLDSNFLGKKNLALDAAYTQTMYWQLYTDSPYFREINYMPEIFLNWHPKINWFIHGGIVHQSNGRGGEYERSWNRVFMDFIFARGNWYFSIKPWVLVFKRSTSDLHNPDIQHYLGNGRFMVAYKFGDNEISIMSRNNLQSGFKRGALQVDVSHHIYLHFNLFMELFSGYGQSLIDYKHRTNGIGIGFSLNNNL